MSDSQVPPPPPDVPPTPPPGQPPPPPPSGMTPGNGGSGNVSENRQVMIVLAYLGPLALVPFLLEKEDQEVQWHAKHGLVLFATGLVLSIVASIIAGLTCIGCFLPFVVAIPILIVHIMCIVKGLNGERFLIPGLSDFADQF